MSKVTEGNQSNKSRSSNSSLDQFEEVPIRETKLGSNILLRHFVFQIIGTALLGFGVACTSYIPPLKDKIANPFHNICIALSAYLVVCLFSPLCYAQFNPSVSLGACLKSIRETKQRLNIRKHQIRHQFQNVDTSSLILKEQNKQYVSKNLKQLLLNVIAQFIGAFIGLLLAYLIYDITIGAYSKMPTAPQLFIQAFGQIIGTFFFIFFILMVTSQMTTFITETSWVHIFICISVFCGRTFSFHVGGLNPALVLMGQVLKMMQTSDTPLSGLFSAFIVSLGSLLGAYLASIFFTSFYSLSVRNWREKSGQ